MSDFRTLNLAIEFYDAAENLGLHGHLRDQLSRAASSIALNLSEGNAKPSVKEKKRYYQTAYASCQECKTILLLAKVENPRTAALLDHLAASVYRLMNSKLNVIRNPHTEK